MIGKKRKHVIMPVHKDFRIKMNVAKEMQGFSSIKDMTKELANSKEFDDLLMKLKKGRRDDTFF